MRHEFSYFDRNNGAHYFFVESPHDFEDTLKIMRKPWDFRAKRRTLRSGSLTLERIVFATPEETGIEIIMEEKPVELTPLEFSVVFDDRTTIEASRYQPMKPTGGYIMDYSYPFMAQVYEYDDFYWTRKIWKVKSLGHRDFILASIGAEAAPYEPDSIKADR